MSSVAVGDASAATAKRLRDQKRGVAAGVAAACRGEGCEERKGRRSEGGGLQRGGRRKRGIDGGYDGGLQRGGRGN